MRFLRLYFCAPSRVQMTNVAGAGANTSVMDYVDRVHNQSCALQSCPADAGSEAGKKCACAWPARTAPDPEKPDALDAGRVEGSIGSRFPFGLTGARAFSFNWLLVDLRTARVRDPALLLLQPRRQFLRYVALPCIHPRVYTLQLQVFVHLLLLLLGHLLEHPARFCCCCCCCCCCCICCCCICMLMLQASM